MNKKEILKITLNLAVIYAIGGLLLSWVYAMAAPVIYRNNLEDKQKALAAMVPESTEKPMKLGEWSPFHKHAGYYMINSPSGPVAYIAESYGKGYSSYINVLVAMDPSFKVTKINVLKHGETPGLGDEIETKWFKDQYMGKDMDHLVVIKGETKDNIQAITGATISTRAVTNAVREAVKFVQGTVQGGGHEGHAAPAPEEGKH